MRTMLTHSKRTEFIKTVAATDTPERLTAGVITGIVRQSPRFVEATFTMSPHGLIPGSVLHIDGADEAEFNSGAQGTFGENGFMVLSNSAVNKAVYECPGDTASATPAPEISYYADIWFRQALLLGLKDYRVPNAGTAYIGGSATDGQQAYGLLPYGAGINQGEVYLPLGNPGASETVMENLADYYLDVGANGDGVFVRYI